MSVLSAFTTGVMAASGGDAGVASYPDRYFDDAMWGSMSAGGMRVSPERAKRLATVYACVSKKSTAVAMLPFKIYQDDGHGGTSLAKNHPHYRMLYSQPNHLQTAYEFKQMMQAHVELRGNAYAEIVLGKTPMTDEMMPMHPDRVVVEQLAGTGRMRYRYSDPLTNTTRILMQDEVFHLREQPDVVGVGQSRISYGCDLLGLGLLQQDYTARFMANDATPGAIITGINYKLKSDEDAFVKNLQDSRTKGNRGRPFLLPPGADMKTLGVTPVDAQLLESIKASDTRICTFFNLLPHTIGVDAGKAATFASTEQFNLMHVQQTVLPMCIMWEQAYQRSFFAGTSYYAKASVATLMRGDAATRGKFYNLMVSTGAMNNDEVRALEDLNPIPDGSGKRFWNPLNWGLLNRTAAIAPQQLPSSTAPVDEEDEEETDDQSDSSDEQPDSEQAAVAARRERREQRKHDAVVLETISILTEHHRRRAA